MFADEIRRRAEGAPRAALPAISVAMWKAFNAGSITDAEAEALSGLIEARKVIPALPAAPARRSVGSRPRTDASMERRRRWAASGRLPPGIAARFTLAEQAVLALVAAEVSRRRDCRLAVGALAAIAGVSATTVRNAIREAGKLGLVTVEERKITGWRNDTNVIRIVSTEWLGWLRLARKNPIPAPKGGGCKSAKGTNTQEKQALREVPRSNRSARYGQGSPGWTYSGFGGSACEPA